MSGKKKIRSFDDLFESFKDPSEKAKKIEEEAVEIRKKIEKIIASLEVENLTKNIDNLEVFEKKKWPKFNKAIDSFYKAARPLLNTAQELQRGKKKITDFLKLKKKN